VAVQSNGHGKILVGLGANCPGPWGSPVQSLHRALAEIERRGVAVEAVSPLYETAALGAARQPPYVNQVALLATRLPASSLLRLLKEIERTIVGQEEIDALCVRELACLKGENP